MSKTKYIFYRLFTKIIYFLECLFLKNDTLCPYCSKEQYLVVFRKKRLIDICYCLNCYLYWTNPMFKFFKFYDLLYREDDPFIKVPPSYNIDSFDGRFNYKKKRYIKIIEYFIHKYKIKRALEFGCSWGYLVYQLRHFGIDAVGVEISEIRRNFGIKKLGLRIEKKIGDLIAKREKFDIIFSFHTLEHLHNISNIFNYFFQLLNKDGILFMEVPHFKKESNFTIIGTTHPLGFTENFFLKNLPKEGFKVKVYFDYADLIGESWQGEDNIVVVATKL
ncbi:MAG: class I SAM-dependent methyltransferase [Candidatus Omnitrophica bacterium]|nr:class I SAM-dependent methyltransferase [Candidatus Omnitrophota bacterium]